MSNESLYKTIEGAVKEGITSLGDIPKEIEQNLSPNINLRDYQYEVFEYFDLYYTSVSIRKNKQMHLLFHMATGSGKTVVMAGLMLYLYKRGFKNFVFFVHTKNIVEKTRSNFLDKQSMKYLFDDKIIIDGTEITINEVENFQTTKDNSINIKFTTVQQLDRDINETKENNMSINDFEDNDVIMISDEAHHINAETKRKTNLLEEERKDMNSWESSVNKAFTANMNNILLDFTATIELKDPEIFKKYKDKIIYDYALLKFRESGYTKDFSNFQSSYDELSRTILAMLLSQYRLKLFNEHNLNKKPVILLKSKTIAESQRFYATFHSFLKTGPLEDLIKQIKESSDDPLLNSMFDYYSSNDIDIKELAAELRFSFNEEKTIIMNQKDDATLAKQKLVNDLENPNNLIRMIFTVDMLNEGWDVLNLFDIVRLYETRQSGGKAISKTTISEAQLIGRGARYYPFKVHEDQEENKRKYDKEQENPLRLCETLLYHSKTDSRYIQELKNALKEIGFEAENEVEFEYVLKEVFKETNTYKEGVIFKNRREKKDRRTITSYPEHFKKDIEIDLTVKLEEVKLLVEEEKKENKKPSDNVKIETFKIQDLYSEYKHIVKKAFRLYPAFNFNILTSYFPNLKNLSEFATSDDYIGGIEIIVKHKSESLSAIDMLHILKISFEKISDNILSIQEEHEGTKTFDPVLIKKFIKDTRRKKMNPDKRGEGIGQSELSTDDKLYYDLSDISWYVYEEHFGTTEEKSFIKYFTTRIAELQNIYKEVYLIRNERNFHIYSFCDGQRFEPDFILLLKKDKHTHFEHQQIFIEPKGNIFIKPDKWKEDFLISMEEKAQVVTHRDDDKYKVIGLPFYNADNNVDFKKGFEKLIAKEV